MGNLIQLLCDFSEASDGVFLRTAIDAEDHPSLDELRGIGAIEAGPKPGTVTCSACDADHPAVIEYKRAAGLPHSFLSGSGICNPEGR